MKEVLFTNPLGIKGVMGISCRDCFIANSSSLCDLSGSCKLQKKTFHYTPTLGIYYKLHRKNEELPGEWYELEVKPATMSQPC